MAKIVKRSDFKGVVDYILDNGKNAKVAAYDGLFMENRDTIAMSFNAQTGFNGSKVDRRLSYSKIDAALQHNRNRERKEITTKVHETATPSASSGTALNELFSGSLGLLNGSSLSYNAADAKVNQEMAEMLRRQKKRKRGIRL